jgi:hypothetical protein
LIIVFISVNSAIETILCRTAFLFNNTLLP